ncbi:hypothetical protein [Pedobacter sp. MW01-1-1]|uniref:hypothetical protein n=1 Tax=Pedobacter sp. MW01-1-1 TaxID=3383027 RepID=UPI003FEE7E15
MEKRESKELAVIERLRIKYGVTRHYVVLSLNGKRTGDVPVTIKKEYEELLKKVDEALNG